MRLVRFSVVLALFATGLGAAIAEPFVTTNQCDSISKYSVEWFEQNTKPEWRLTSLESNALFYSQGLSAKAKQFARQAAKVTIWDIWPCENYQNHQTRNNPLWCIMSDPKQEKTYFENMSAAFARKAVKIATVIHMDINNPPISGIWKRIEFEVLKRSGLIDQIIAIDAKDAGNQKIEWPFDVMLDSAQKILYGRDEDVAEDLEKRWGGVCPLIKVDSKHPLS